jgi:hypothetical protein
MKMPIKFKINTEDFKIYFDNNKKTHVCENIETGEKTNIGVLGILMQMGILKPLEEEKTTEEKLALLSGKISQLEEKINDLTRSVETILRTSERKIEQTEAKIEEKPKSEIKRRIMKKVLEQAEKEESEEKVEEEIEPEEESVEVEDEEEVKTWMEI